MEEVANPIAKASFDRVEPAVEKMDRRLGFRLRQARRRAIARHGVISAGVPTPESLVGPSWRLRRLQFPTTPATAPLALRGLSVSQSGCARTPMMARSKIAPLQRPNTFEAAVTFVGLGPPSCNARPGHTSWHFCDLGDQLPLVGFRIDSA